MKMYGVIKKERKRISIVAGMPTNNPKDMKLRAVGYKIIEFTYDVNPDNKDDKVLINQREIKRVFKN